MQEDCTERDIFALKIYATGVYAIKNLQNGKAYVGSAAKTKSRGMLGRCRDHRKTLRSGAHNNAHLLMSWRKYGEAAFRFVVLEECPSEACVEREQHWIDAYDAANHAKGYNISPTAGSNLGAKYGPLSEEHKQRISALHKGLWADPEYKAARLAKMEAEGVWERVGKSKRGQTFSDESKVKLAKSKKAFWDDPERSANASARLSEASRRRMADPAVKAKMGWRLRELWADPEHRAMRAAAISAGKMASDYTHSQETREKISEGAKQYFANNPEARKKIGEQNRKQWEDTEFRAKMAVVNSGRTISQSQKDKVSAALRGIKRSSETRAKMAEAQQKKRWPSEDKIVWILANFLTFPDGDHKVIGRRRIDNALEIARIIGIGAVSVRKIVAERTSKIE